MKNKAKKEFDFDFNDSLNLEESVVTPPSEEEKEASTAEKKSDKVGETTQFRQRIEEISNLSAEDRIRIKKEEKERLAKELEEKSKLKAQQERDEKERRRKEEIERQKREASENARKEEEAFYSQFGLTPDGKTLDEIDEAAAFKAQLEKAEQEKKRREEEATRRFAVEELEFSIGVDGETSNPNRHVDQEALSEEKIPTEQDIPEETLTRPFVFKKEEPSPKTKSRPVAEECSFCKISQKKLKARTLYLSQHTMVFLDPKPIHRGQLLICPRGHYSCLDDLPHEVLIDMMSVAQRMAKALKQSGYDSPGVSFYISESVDIEVGKRHVYMSAIPRRPDDGVTIKFGQKDKIERDEMSKIAARLKEIFANEGILR